MPPRFFGWICDHREEFIGGEEMTIEESSTAFNKVFSELETCGICYLRCIHSRPNFSGYFWEIFTCGKESV